MKLTKSIVHKVVSDELNNRIVRIEDALNGHKEGLLAESTSSAGDKHNTSRAMMHLEEEKLRNQLSQFSKLNKVLHGLKPDKTHKDITLGSLVNTNKGWLYISVPLGKVKIELVDVMVISLASPIGQKLQGKKSGEKMKFNNVAWEIISVE